MNEHPYYEELGALAASGHISEKECHELREHLRTCESCRNVERAFRDIVHCLWPSRSQLQEIVDRLLELPPDQDARTRFLERAKREGINFSRDVSRRKSPGSQ
jgi:hypothetical protein